MEANAAYANAIDILMGGKFDSKAIVIELAKAHPALFVELHGKCYSPHADLEDAVKGVYLVTRSKVEAIRKCRQLTGMGLKEAKDWCDVRIPAWDAGLPPGSISAPAPYGVPRYAEPEF